MKHWFKWVCPLLIAASGSGFANTEGNQKEKQNVLTQMVTSVVESRVVGKPAPVLNLQWGDYLQHDTAYIVQSKAVKQWLGSGAPKGFKAGLTSNTAQQKFGVDNPVSGVLLPGAKLTTKNDKYIVHRSEFNRPMLEAEIGFRLKERVSKPIANVNELKTKVAVILPVIELPDLAFDNASKLKGVDIIANNVAVKQYIEGQASAVQGIDIDTLNIAIKKNGELLLRGRGSDAMGSQWTALLWLINQTVANGWEIQPGQLLITGALGRMLPADTGMYHVDFGYLGRIDFFVD